MPDPNPRQTLGMRIRQLREARGLTQDELAAKCSMHRTYISAVEHGARNTSFDNLLRLAEALDVRLHTLLDEI